MISNIKSNNPIAIYKGNDGRKELLYLHDKYEMIEKLLEKKYNKKDIEYVLKNIKMGKVLENKYKDIENEIKKLLKENKEYNAYNGKFEIIPNQNEPEHMYLSGPSKCGKSYQVSKYIEKYKLIYPDNNIYLISDTHEDKLIDLLNYKKSVFEILENLSKEELNSENLKGILKKKYKIKDEDYYTTRIQFEDAIGLEPENIENSLIVFDDIDAIKDEKLQKQIYKLNDNFFSKARHQNISVIRTNHACVDGNNTKKSIQNSSIIYIFPQAGNKGNIEDLLRIHAGLNYDQRKELLKIDTRSIAIRKTSPLSIITDDIIKIL